MNYKLKFKDEKPMALLLGVKSIEWDNPPQSHSQIPRNYFKILYPDVAFVMIISLYVYHCLILTLPVHSAIIVYIACTLHNTVVYQEPYKWTCIGQETNPDFLNYKILPKTQLIWVFLKKKLLNIVIWHSHFISWSMRCICS